LIQFIAGASTLASAVIALFFLRFWRDTGDRLFAIFSVAFAVFAVNRIVLTILDETNEARQYVYLIRLAAFVLILIGIVEKNRSASREP
jgi:membrane protein CcdC involved in cytochrome C biogenesis